ncbi:hypothetical protein [Holdemania massiliensis]|nr:hypothetical protein [Holdemania massiliensis]
MKEKRKLSNLKHHEHRLLTMLVTVCLLLGTIQGKSSVIRAESSAAVFQIGDQAVAILENGRLTVSGSGDTYDYEAQTSPFLHDREKIQSIRIEEGITYIGAYLFYNLGQVSGILELPSTILGMGEAAFSGDNFENAPKFTGIRNHFVSGVIEQEFKQEEGGELPGSKGNETPPSASPEGPEHSEGTPDSDLDHNSASEEAPAMEDEETNAETETPLLPTPWPAVNEPVKAAGSQTGIVKLTVDQEAENESGSIPIVEQRIANPSTLFYAGQSGYVVCSQQNTTFLKAAEDAGYQSAEEFAEISLDDCLRITLPMTQGQIQLPECPETLMQSAGEDPLFKLSFHGWSKTKPDDLQAEALTALTPGESLDLGDDKSLSLYSIWKLVPQYTLSVHTEFSNSASVIYSLIDSRTGEEFIAPSGFRLQYQWQYRNPNEEVWRNIENADQSMYQREIQPEDNKRQFRCGIQAVSLMRAVQPGEFKTLYSDPAAGITENTAIYIDQTNGNDNNTGLSDKNAVATFEKALSFLKSMDEGGSLENNTLIIIGKYNFSVDAAAGTTISLLEEGKPATIKGATPEAALIGIDSNPSGNDNDCGIEVLADVKIESIQLQCLNHFYGNGHNITLGEGVSNTGLKSSIYLYGGGRSVIKDSVGEISVSSGNIVRIVGYVRSFSGINLEAGNKLSKITVKNNASVGTIVAGVASGGVSNGNVEINVEGGSVTSILGGNQGFNNTAAAYVGRTNINISGGKVGTVWGAGTGRIVSIPTFQGALNMNITGGSVAEIYGAGSAAYTVSPASGEKTKVTITVENATVGTIYAAGKGADSAIKTTDAYKDLTKDPKDFGSFTGEFKIEAGSGALITGDIYGSGAGVVKGNTITYETNENAYFKGQGEILINKGAVVQGSVYGGGKGVAENGYEKCARICEDSSVNVVLNGGQIQGSIFGGGQTAGVLGSTSVEIKSGTVIGNVYGGGKQGLVTGKANVTIQGGTMESSVYGGALGETEKFMLLGGATVNMTGGWIRGNLYGGSELSNDGKEGNKPEAGWPDIVFVNLVGGTVSGKVFGGGYRGIVNGSTHLHIGSGAMDECLYYQNHSAEKPALTCSELEVRDSVYAGGDYGGADAKDYSKITVQGTSHVYIDGTGYKTGNSLTAPEMKIDGGVFGSGASCDAGSTRLVTLKNYGGATRGEGSNGVLDVSRTLSAIQRADRVTLINSHVRLTGLSDIANTNQTALYSLNRIGDHGKVAEDYDNGLVLQGGSTLVLESAMIETANFKSMDLNGKNALTQETLKASPNTVKFETGTVFQVSYEGLKETLYGAVIGYAYMQAAEKASVYAYARPKITDASSIMNKDDGGFVAVTETEPMKEIPYQNVETNYRYWQLSGENASADRQTVLTAQKIEGEEGFLVAEGVVELPQLLQESHYKIESITLPNGLVLVQAAMDGTSKWIDESINKSSGETSENMIKLAQDTMQMNPLTCFGLFMEIGEGFDTTDTSNTVGKIISADSIKSESSSSIVGQTSPSAQANSRPKLNFYLTYYNPGITASTDLGKVEILLAVVDGINNHEKIEISVDILTQANSLEDQTVDLYATSNGSYTGQLIIPAGADRELSLTSVVSKPENMVPKASNYTQHQFSVAMVPAPSQGWMSAGLMTEACDLKEVSKPVTIGKTDSRYQAVINFTLENNGQFQAKNESDKVELKLTEGTGKTVTITLRIHWQESIVRKITAQPGRKYNLASLNSAANLEINRYSSLTVEFELAGSPSMKDLWLEFRDEKGNAALPKAARLTLIHGSDYYVYSITGNEAKGQILLSEFRSIEDNTTIESGVSKPIRVIVDFDKAEISVGAYTLRLRNSTGADTQWCTLTVNNEAANIAEFSRTEPDPVFTKDKVNLNLEVTPSSDTRYTEVGAVFGLEAGQRFPEGTVFTYAGKAYYPAQDQVYIPLGAGGDYSIELDTTQSAGFTEGEVSLNAKIFPMGENAVNSKGESLERSLAMTVKKEKETGLNVELAEGSRIFKADEGRSFKFSVTYLSDASETVEVIPQTKTAEGNYEFSADWKIEQEDSADSNKNGRTKIITVTPPQSIPAGTYRLRFKAAGQEVPYNLIAE